MKHIRSHGAVTDDPATPKPSAPDPLLERLTRGALAQGFNAPTRHAHERTHVVHHKERGLPHFLVSAYKQVNTLLFQSVQCNPSSNKTTYRSDRSKTRTTRGPFGTMEPGSHFITHEFQRQTMATDPTYTAAGAIPAGQSRMHRVWCIVCAECVCRRFIMSRINWTCQAQFDLSQRVTMH